MSNYPFDTFPLTKRVGIVNPVANLDARYGPWPTFNDALTGFSSAVRHVGLTVAVSGAGGITEYWYKNGIADNNLVLKTVEETGFKSLSGKYEDVSTAFITNSGDYILQGGNTKSTNLSVGTNDNFSLVFETNNLPRITITNTGNVGVGIGTPTDRLEVGGTLKITGNLPSIRTTTNRFSVNETNTTPQNETGMVSQFSSGPYGRSAFAITHTGINTAFFGLDSQLFSIGGEGNTDVRFVKGLSYSATDILNSGTEVMRIKASNSSVGIGTNSPNQKLTVTGNVSADGITYTNSLNLKCLTLPLNVTNYTLDATVYNTVYNTVSADTTYLIYSLSKGTTFTFYVSGNHESLKRHLINVIGSRTNIDGAGQADQFYTFKNHVTKVTITRVEEGNTTISRVFGNAEIIRTDLNAGQGGLGFITAEDIPGDVYFNNNSLLMHMEGTPGSQTFTDSSTNNFTLTPAGNVQISTTITRFGNGSAFFDGNGDYIDAPINSAFDFGTGDFTIELWAYPTRTGSHTCIARWGAGGNALFLAIDTTAGVVVYLNNSGAALIAGGIIQTDQWHHIALTRQGANIRAFINGVQAGSTYNIGAAAIIFSPNNLRIGRDHFGNPFFQGYMDEVRITKGVARYTANFSTPIGEFSDSSVTIDGGFLLQENGDRLVIRNFT